MSFCRRVLAFAVTLAALGFAGCAHSTSGSLSNDELRDRIAAERRQQASDAAYRRLESQNANVGPAH